MSWIPGGDSALGKQLPLTSTLDFNPFPLVENLILEAIEACYWEMSPERLYCDGEVSRSEVVGTSKRLERQLAGLQFALGRAVSEFEILELSEAKRAFEQQNKERMKEFTGNLEPRFRSAIRA